MEFIKVFERQSGFISLKLQIIMMGNDICLILTGGERPHLGAVAVAQVRASLQHIGQVSSTVSNITLLGHKEDEIARKIASVIAVNANSNVVVCCGIHSDNLSPEEIGDISETCQKLLEDATNYIVNTISL